MIGGTIQKTGEKIQEGQSAEDRGRYEISTNGSEAVKKSEVVNRGESGREEKMPQEGGEVERLQSQLEKQHLTDDTEENKGNVSKVPETLREIKDTRGVMNEEKPEKTSLTGEAITGMKSQVTNFSSSHDNQQSSVTSQHRHVTTASHVTQGFNAATLFTKPNQQRHQMAPSHSTLSDGTYHTGHHHGSSVSGKSNSSVQQQQGPHLPVTAPGSLHHTNQLWKQHETMSMELARHKVTVLMKDVLMPYE